MSCMSTVDQCVHSQYFVWLKWNIALNGGIIQETYKSSDVFTTPACNANCRFSIPWIQFPEADIPLNRNTTSMLHSVGQSTHYGSKWQEAKAIYEINLPKSGTDPNIKHGLNKLMQDILYIVDTALAYKNYAFWP